MKFKRIEEGMQIKVFDSAIYTISKVNHKHKLITVNTGKGDFLFHKNERGFLWDVYEEPAEAQHLENSDYQFLLDLSLATYDKVWFDEIHANMQMLGVRNI
ncbi:hypothetical protein [Solibacillus isronensis]|uniref:hypothetical protein n=1 Tax=Solibacillus isronensis TaxID=412383 RepID=UPI0039A35E3F